MIRSAVFEDASRLAEIHIASWQAAYAEILPADFLDGLSDETATRTAQWQDWLSIESPRRSVLVVADGDDIVGFAHLGPSGDKDLKPNEVGELYSMYLDPARYRRGWGGELMTAVFEELRAGSFTAASLWVMTANTAAQAFYEQAGWEADGAESDHCLGITIPAVRFRASL
ncbi:MAG: GNAT family N-acetyltransferase [Acidimicrobiia bacterium]|nr:GNAT family N-acetyltransferase [Acidimicrobiia bacterium]